MLSLPLMERSLAAAAQIGVIFISAAPEPEPEPEPGRGESGGGERRSGGSRKCSLAETTLEWDHVTP